MTKKEMNELADIIIDKIRTMQEKLDEQCFTKMDKEQPDWEIEAIGSANKKTLKKAKSILLEQLENCLKAALIEEDYDLAQILKEKIVKLNNKPGI